MAGYIIYSLDWGKFQKFVERPTPGQLAAFATRLCDGLDEYEFAEGDPLRAWPTNAKKLAPIAAKRLLLPDWYGDLSPGGRAMWESAVIGVCMGCEEVDVGFRQDSDGVYFDVLELAWKQLGVVPGQISDVALSAFGYRPYRFHAPTDPTKTRKEYDKEQVETRKKIKEAQEFVDELLEDTKKSKTAPDPKKMMDEVKEGEAGSIMSMLKGLFADVEEGGGEATELGEWYPAHSMHTPEEVQKMLAELRSVESAVLKAKKKDVREDYEEELMPALTSVAEDGRMLFIQVDT
jgi:hypothetical protein